MLNPAEKKKIIYSKKSPQSQTSQPAQFLTFLPLCPLSSTALCTGTSARSDPRIQQLGLWEQTPASTGTEPLTSASSGHFLSLFFNHCDMFSSTPCQGMHCKKHALAQGMPWHISIKKWAPLTPQVDGSNADRFEQHLELEPLMESSMLPIHAESTFYFLDDLWFVSYQSILCHSIKNTSVHFSSIYQV